MMDGTGDRDGDKPHDEQHVCLEKVYSPRLVSLIFSFPRKSSNKSRVSPKVTKGSKSILKEIHDSPNTARSQPMRWISNIQRLLVRTQFHTELTLAS